MGRHDQWALSLRLRPIGIWTHQTDAWIGAGFGWFNATLILLFAESVVHVIVTANAATGQTDAARHTSYPVSLHSACRGCTPVSLLSYMLDRLDPLEKRAVSELAG